MTPLTALRPELLAAEAGAGFEAPGVEDFFFEPFFSFDLLGIEFAVDRVVTMMFFGTALVAVFFLAAFRRPELVPGKLQAAGEAVYGFVRNGIAGEVIGARGLAFAPYLTTLFCFVLVMNFFEIVPLMQFPVTSRIAYPAFLTVITFVMFIAVGVRQHGAAKYFKDALFPPGVPKPMYILLTPIELFSTFLSRPFTLAVRLFANMFAGHLLLLIFFLGAEYLLTRDNFSVIFGPISFLVAVLLTFFEFLVQLLQAYIFTVLTAVYVGGALAEEH